MRRSTHTKLRRLVGTSVVVAATVIPASAAMAADYPNGGGGGTETQANTQVKASQTSTLPFTGGDVVGLAVIGAGAALAGTVMVRRSRRTAGV